MEIVYLCNIVFSLGNFLFKTFYQQNWDANKNGLKCSLLWSSLWKVFSREREMFYLTTHSTHFIYGYMASDIWLRTILIVRKETRCWHIGNSYRLTARVLLYAPSHRQDNTYDGLCYTSRGALAGARVFSKSLPGSKQNVSCSLSVLSSLVVDESTELRHVSQQVWDVRHDILNQTRLDLISTRLRDQFHFFVNPFQWFNDSIKFCYRTLEKRELLSKLISNRGIGLI